MQRSAGIVVHPADARPAQGLTIVLSLGVGPLRITAPCRVVEVIDEPSRAGFTYATLPGHPEGGAETFLVETDAEGKPAAWYARIGAPPPVPPASGG